MTETELPLGWRTVQLSDLGRLIRGRGVTRADLAATGVPCLRYGEIYTKYQDTIDDLQSYVSEEIASTATPLAHGDIIFTASGETREEIGKAVAWLGYGRAVSGGDTVLLRDHGQDPTFLVHALNGNAVARQKFSHSKGDAVVHLHASELAQMSVVIPQLEEQRRIAVVLRTLNSGLDRLQELEDALRLRAQRLGGLLVSGAVTFDEFKDRPRRLARLRDLGSTYSGLSGKSKADFSGEGSQYVPYMNIFANIEVDHTRLDRVRVLTGERQNRVKQGDVLFTASSETASEVGMPSVVVERSEEECYLNSFSLGFRMENTDIVLPKYVAYYFRTPLGRRSMWRIAQGATRYNLSAKHLLALTVSLPSVAEQEAVVDCLDASHDVVDTVIDLRKAMLKEKRAVMRLMLGPRQGDSRVDAS